MSSESITLNDGKKYNFKSNLITDRCPVPVIKSIDENPVNLGKRADVKITFVDMPVGHTGYVPYNPGPCTAIAPTKKSFFRKLIAKLLPLFILCMLTTGCFFRPEAIVAHPDSPFLIQEVKGSYAHVLVYDKSKNKMIDYGWVNMKLKFQGYTLSKYDWEKIIAKRAIHGK